MPLPTPHLPKTENDTLRTRAEALHLHGLLTHWSEVVTQPWLATRGAGARWRTSTDGSAGNSAACGSSSAKARPRSLPFYARTVCGSGRHVNWRRQERGGGVCRPANRSSRRCPTIGSITWDWSGRQATMPRRCSTGRSSNAPAAAWSVGSAPRISVDSSHSATSTGLGPSSAIGAPLMR
jgi:hypothetical protein